jgi:hypothetical protein
VQGIGHLHALAGDGQLHILLDIVEAVVALIDDHRRTGRGDGGCCLDGGTAEQAADGDRYTHGFHLGFR